MKPKFNWLKDFDILSSEAKFTFNKNGDTRYSTILGGVFSVFGIIICGIFTGYFMINLFTKKQTSVVTALDGSDFINLTHSHQAPFLLRLSDKNNKPYDEPERMYKLSLKYWYGGSNDTLQNVGQKTEDIPMEKCDINKHFGIYKELFMNLTDIDTFYCAIPRPYNQSIYGVYGGVYPFGYYHFYVSMCLNNESCFDKELLEKTFSNTYLDLRTIDYLVDSHNSKQNKHPHIKIERFMISNTVYKRIWFYINGISYNKDDGFWFSFNKVENFFQYESLRYDIDHRDINVGTIPGTFVTLTFITTGKIMCYFQTFTKIQELIGTISGVVKFVIVVFYIINYPHSQNSYYLKLMNDFLYIDMNIFKRRERAIKLGYNLSLCSRVSQSATNINSSSYMNPTGLLNVQSNLTRFQRANTKTNCQLAPKSKFSQTFHSATLKSKIGNDNANDNTNVIQNEVKENKTLQNINNNKSLKLNQTKEYTRKKVQFKLCESLLPLKFLFKKEKYGATLKTYCHVVNDKLNLIRILQELDKIEVIEEAMKISDSFSPTDLTNKLGQIPVIMSPDKNKRNSFLNMASNQRSNAGVSLLKKSYTNNNN